MLDASAIAAGLRLLAPDQLRTALENFLPQGASSAEKISAIEAGLQSPAGQSVRDAMARWVVDEIVPVDALVPETYKQVAASGAGRHDVRGDAPFSRAARAKTSGANRTSPQDARRSALAAPHR